MNPHHKAILASIGRQAGTGAASAALNTTLRGIAEGAEPRRVAEDSARAALDGALSGAGRAAGGYLAEATVIGATRAVAGRSAARSLARAGAEATTANLARMSAGAAARTAGRANVVATVGIGLVEQSVNTYRLARGEIDAGEYGCRSAETAGGTAGGIGGGYLGALIGSAICPGVGTVVGVLVGGLLGSFGGERGASALVR